MRSHILFTAANLIAFSQAINLNGRILWNDVCQDITRLGQAAVVLDNGKFSGGVRQNGMFSLRDVEPGSYILSVIAHDFTFDNLRVDVPASDSVPEVRPYVPGTPHSPASVVSLPYPITLSPRQKNVYFVERESFNLLGMLSNPMMLLMVGTGALMLGMPYLMKNLDPEIANEVKERQAKFANIQNTIQNGDIRNGISALLSAPEEETNAGAKKAGSAASPSRAQKVARGKQRR